MISRVQTWHSAETIVAGPTSQLHFFGAFTTYEKLHCSALGSVECHFFCKYLQEYNEISDSVTINITEMKLLCHYFHAIQMLYENPISYHLLKGCGGGVWVFFPFVLLCIKAHNNSFTVIPCC